MTCLVSPRDGGEPPALSGLLRGEGLRAELLGLAAVMVSMWTELSSGSLREVSCKILIKRLI